MRTGLSLALALVLALVIVSCATATPASEYREDPAATPDLFAYPTALGLTPASMDAMVGNAKPTVAVNSDWSSYQSDELGIVLSYPPSWQALPLDGSTGIGLYPPGSEPDLPTAMIKIEWLNVPFSPDQPLVETGSPVGSIEVEGIEGRAYQDSQFAIPTQSFYLELPYQDGTLFFIVTRGPSVDLTPQFDEILKTIAFLDNGSDFDGPIATEAPEELAATEAPYEVLTGSIDIDEYCAYKYGNNAVAVMGDRWDAYSWNCYRNSQLVGSIDMTEACQNQYTDMPTAIMGDRWDAYSWYCTNQ